MSEDEDISQGKYYFMHNISNFIRITVNTRLRLRLQFKVYFIFIGCYLARNLKSSHGECIYSSVVQLKLTIRSNAIAMGLKLCANREEMKCQTLFDYCEEVTLKKNIKFNRSDCNHLPAII